jgi:hypothetical protein
MEALLLLPIKLFSFSLACGGGGCVLPIPFFLSLFVTFEDHFYFFPSVGGGLQGRKSTPPPPLSLRLPGLINLRLTSFPHFPPPSPALLLTPDCVSL